MDAIKDAISRMGTQRKLAELLDIPPACVSQWVNGYRRVPAQHCVPIEKATDGAVTRYDLRPDIFGEPEDRGAA